MSVHLERAQALIEVGRYDDAIQALAAELRDDPQSWAAYCLQAVISLRRARPDHALAAAGRAARMAPTQEFPHRLCAAAYQGLGKRATAVASARTAAGLAPHFWPVHTMLATSLLNMDTIEARVEAYEAAMRACELAPDKAETHVALAKVRTAMADTRGANRAFRQALELDPINVEAIHGLGVNEVNAGRVRAGSDKIRHAAAAAPHEEILRINTQDSARVWLWSVVDRSVLLVMAQIALMLAHLDPTPRRYVSLALSIGFVSIVCRSYLRLDPVVRKLVWRFEFGSERSMKSQTKAKVLAFLAFLDAALIGTRNLWVLDLCAFGIVAMGLGRWRVRSILAIRRMWRRWSHRRALAKQIRTAQPRQDTP